MADIQLNDRVAVVTGASRGLGRAMSLALAEAGARVVPASPETAQLGELAAEIESRCGKGRALALTTDITQLTDCERVLSESLRVIGGLHILFNNARRIIRDASLPPNEAAARAMEPPVLRKPA